MRLALHCLSPNFLSSISEHNFALSWTMSTLKDNSTIFLPTCLGSAQCSSFTLQVSCWSFVPRKNLIFSLPVSAMFNVRFTTFESGVENSLTKLIISNESAVLAGKFILYLRN